jgi:predicted O-methyltransferase YrrM
MDISKALNIEGWMTEPELKWLAEQASKHKVIAEIGSYKGRSTRALADNTTGIVYAIDDFRGPREIEVANRDFIFDQFVANMAGLEGRVNVIRANHRNLPPIDFAPDMVFIDGAHEYEGVRADIEFWAPRLAPNGLLCGHDYLPDFPGVLRAVHDLPSYAVAPGTSIWYVNLP